MVATLYKFGTLGISLQLFSNVIQLVRLVIGIAVGNHCDGDVRQTRCGNRTLDVDSNN